MNTLLEPRSIAVIGASNTPGKVGHDIVHNLVTQGYAGKVYPVNPKDTIIQNTPAFSSISAIPQEVDLAIIVIPAKFVPDVVAECITKKVHTIMIISAGFSEVHTEEGLALEQDILQKLQGTSIKLIGPNCLGLLRPSIGMNASFATALPPMGNTALVSQSGAMVVAIMDGASKSKIGFSTVASIGNKAQMDESDWLEELAKDKATKVIGMYLESIKDGPRFMRVAKKVSATKHIVILKSGVSEHGKEAASSHTGALAGNDAAIDAAFAQSGIHRAHTTEEFLELLQVLSSQPKLLSPNIAIITNAGGPGILATDATEIYGLHLPHFAERTLAALKQHLPSTAGLVNPVDVIGDAGTDRYQAAIDACCKDPNVDGLCIILTPQVMTPSSDIAKIIVDANITHNLLPIVTSFMGEDSVQEARSILGAGGVPTFDTPEQAIAALSALYRPNEELSERKEPESTTSSKKTQPAFLLKTQKPGLLPEADTLELFAHYDLQLPKQGVATTADEAVTIAQGLHYPVIAKISSPQIVHKTDVGGVVANIKNDEEMRKAYTNIIENVTNHPEIRNSNPEIRGVFIQKFLPVGNEFIVGAMRDATFGPMIMVGLGGIYTELFKDTSFRIAPIDEEMSYEMLQELESWQLLLGMRGAAQSDIDEVASIIQVLGTMMQNEPHIKEIDMNPILVGENEVVIADVKVITQ